MVGEGYKLPAIAIALDRSKSATTARKRKLGLSMLAPDGSRRR
jgi:hypothetical protein